MNSRISRIGRLFTIDIETVRLSSDIVFSTGCRKNKGIRRAAVINNVMI